MSTYKRKFIILLQPKYHGMRLKLIDQNNVLVQYIMYGYAKPASLQNLIHKLSQRYSFTSENATIQVSTMFDPFIYRLYIDSLHI